MDAAEGIIGEEERRGFELEISACSYICLTFPSFITSLKLFDLFYAKQKCNFVVFSRNLGRP